MKRPLPRTTAGWFKEIKLAIADARGAGPFGELIGESDNQRQPVPPGSLGLSQVSGQEAGGSGGESSHGNGAGELRGQLRSRWEWTTVLNRSRYWRLLSVT